MTSTSTDQNGWATGTLQTSQGNPEQYVPQSSWVTTPVYKWASATVPATTEITSDSSSFTKLLESKVKQATEEMQRDLEGQLLYGKGRYVRNEELRRCIGDAYDMKFEQEYPKAEDLRKADMNEAVDKIKAEREEEKARQVFDTLDGIFEGLDYTGAMVGWTVQFEVNGKEYTYGAVLSGDGCWYITGRETTGRKPEDFKAFVADQALRAHRVEFRGTVL